jgi:hypothetical protein
MSGHSKWANIKHKKAKADAQRGAAFTKASRELHVAVKQGGPDPETNFRLKMAIQAARSVNMPNDTINRAIKRAAGDADGDMIRISLASMLCANELYCFPTVPMRPEKAATTATPRAMQSMIRSDSKSLARHRRTAVARRSANLTLPPPNEQERSCNSCSPVKYNRVASCSPVNATSPTAGAWGIHGRKTSFAATRLCKQIDEAEMAQASE